MTQHRDCEPDPRRVDADGLAFKGSQLQLQLYVNARKERFEEEAIRAGVIAEGARLEWISPLAAEGYREYRDAAFLERLSIADFIPRLGSFWPKGGPCWDGLARWETDTDSGILLLEAKSYPEEARSSLMARSDSSVLRIRQALRAISSWLGLPDLPTTWTTDFYQTANRLAYLYFLREMCGVHAGLAFVLVVNDPTHRATSRSDWELAWTAMWNEMRLDHAPANVHALLLPGLPRPVSESEGSIT